MYDRYAEGSPQVLGKEGLQCEREGDESRNGRSIPRMCMKQLVNKYTKTVQNKKIPPSKELSLTQTTESATASISRAFLGSKPRAFSEVS